MAKHKINSTINKVVKHRTNVTVDKVEHDYFSDNNLASFSAWVNDALKKHNEAHRVAVTKAANCK